MVQGSSGLSGVACYIHGILILGHTREKHFTNLRTALKGIKEYGCCLKKSKCQFFTKRARVLEHTVCSILPEEVKPTKSCITSNLEVPTPTDKLKLQSFLGMLTYNATFLPNMSHTLHPLINCYGKTHPEYVKPNNTKLLKAAKHLLSAALAHYDVKKTLKLYCDASAYGLGACFGAHNG